MGIIPAYAGSTCTTTKSSRAVADHPRIRGEHRWSEFSPTAPGGIIPAYAGSTGRWFPWPQYTVGSSPHTRGARAPIRRCCRLARIIPAYAGSTVVDRGGDPRVEDHPRIRGEHSCSLYPWVAQGRIIPAYAGSTLNRPVCCTSAADHPRIRGEHLVIAVDWDLAAGSSPHTRGAREDASRAAHVARIIPAYAGSTRVGRRPCRRSEDHPRIRGEHHHPIPRVSRINGSSPHTRGAPPADVRKRPNRGIIPAYAGSTRISQGPDGASRDHPRIRGEHFVKYGIVPSHTGSSPHTRGAPREFSSRGFFSRIIPAYAGSTIQNLARVP